MITGQESGVDGTTRLTKGRRQFLPFTLPAHRADVRWEVVMDARKATERRPHLLLCGRGSYELEARSLALLRLHRED